MLCWHESRIDWDCFTRDIHTEGRLKPGFVPMLIVGEELQVAQMEIVKVCSRKKCEFFNLTRRAVLQLAVEVIVIIMLGGFSLPVTLRDRNLLSSLSVSSWPSKGESLNMKMIITPVANLKKYTK